MTDSTQYPAVPLVLESWQEAHRRDAAAINFLLNRVMGASEDPDAPDTLPEHIADKDNPHEVMHAQLTDTTANDHHNKSHAHNGADGSGTVAHSDLTGRTADDHHDRLHTHTDPLDGVVDHTSLTTIGTKTHAQLETDIDTIDAAFQAIRDVAVEKLYMNSPSAETAGNITNYGSVDKHVDCTAVENLATGVITINTAGYYQVVAYISLAGTGNNNWYGLTLDINGAPSGLIGGIVWDNNWEGGAINGIFHGDLTIGDTINLSWSVNGSVITPFDGQFGIRLVVKA